MTNENSSNDDSGREHTVRSVLSPVALRLFGDSAIERAERDVLASRVEAAIHLSERSSSAERGGAIHERQLVAEWLRGFGDYRPNPTGNMLAARIDCCEHHKEARWRELMQAAHCAFDAEDALSWICSTCKVTNHRSRMTCKQGCNVEPATPEAGEADVDPSSPNAVAVLREALERPCPVTGYRFFMTMKHPELGWVPTYGGPYDSYTPVVVDHKTGELSRWRYCHDRGEWIEVETLNVRLIDDEEPFPNAPPAAARSGSDEAMLLKLRWLRDTVGVDVERMFARAQKEKDGRVTSAAAPDSVTTLLTVVGSVLEWTAREAPYQEDADQRFPWWRSLQAAQAELLDERLATSAASSVACTCAKADPDEWCPHHGRLDDLKAEMGTLREQLAASDAICDAQSADIHRACTLLNRGVGLRFRSQPGDPTLRHAVAWMRATYPQNKHAVEWANELERVFLAKPSPTLIETIESGGSLIAELAKLDEDDDAVLATAAYPAWQDYEIDTDDVCTLEGFDGVCLMTGDIQASAGLRMTRETARTLASRLNAIVAASRRETAGGNGATGLELEALPSSTTTPADGSEEAGIISKREADVARKCDECPAPADVMIETNGGAPSYACDEHELAVRTASLRKSMPMPSADAAIARMVALVEGYQVLFGDACLVLAREGLDGEAASLGGEESELQDRINAQWPGTSGALPFESNPSQREHERRLTADAPSPGLTSNEWRDIANGGGTDKARAVMGLKPCHASAITSEDPSCPECDGTKIVDGIGAGGSVVEVKCMACEPPSEDVLRMVHAFDDEERKESVRQLAARMRATEAELAERRRASDSVDQELARLRAGMRQIAHCRNPNPCETCMAIARGTVEPRSSNASTAKNAKAYEALVEYEVAQFGLASKGTDRRVVETICRLMAQCYDAGYDAAEDRPGSAITEQLREAVLSLVWTVERDSLWPENQPYQKLISAAVAKGKAALDASTAKTPCAGEAHNFAQTAKSYGAKTANRSGAAPDAWPIYRTLARKLREVADHDAFRGKNCVALTFAAQLLHAAADADEAPITRAGQEKMP